MAARLDHLLREIPGAVIRGCGRSADRFHQRGQVAICASAAVIGSGRQTPRPQIRRVLPDQFQRAVVEADDEHLILDAHFLDQFHCLLHNGFAAILQFHVPHYRRIVFEDLEIPLHFAELRLPILPHRL